MRDPVLCLIFGFGCVAIVEGLVLALAPSHLRRTLEILTRLQDEPRRWIALLSITTGIAFVWFAHG